MKQGTSLSLEIPVPTHQTLLLSQQPHRWPYNTPKHYSLSSSSSPQLLSTSDGDDVHDLLPAYNLSKGLLPADIKSYTISDSDDSFTIELSLNPCYVKFDGQLVYYDKIIKGKLGNGTVSGVSGIQAKKLFIWVYVTEIDVDEDIDMIEFHVGALSQKLPAKDFQDIHSCKAKGLTLRDSFYLLES